MIEYFLSTPTIRAIAAEALLILDIGLLSFITLYLWREYRKRGFREARQRVGNQAAIAFGVHMIGLILFRAWTVTFGWFQRQGYDTARIEDLDDLILLGLVIAVFGMACSVRVFSPARWGHWGWIAVFLAALAFVGAMHAP